MSRQIIGHFSNKDVRTEVRVEQRKIQPWPSITICLGINLLQHFTCHYKFNLGFNGFPAEFCSIPLKEGCKEYNPNGTDVHEGSIKRGKDFYYAYPYQGSSLLKDHAILNVFIHDPETARNSSHIFYLQDLDTTGGIAPGNYEFLLEMTEIEKLGQPYNSKCTKQQYLGDKDNSKYSYAACLDKCMATISLERCGDIPKAFQDYLPEHKERSIDNKTIRCFSSLIESYLRDPKFLSQCDCQQPCKQRFYPTTRNLAGKFSENTWNIRLRFKSKMVNVITEHPLYSTEELISQVGGSCGLFLGMSLLSIVEIIFHALISLARYCV